MRSVSLIPDQSLKRKSLDNKIKELFGIYTLNLISRYLELVLDNHGIVTATFRILSFFKVRKKRTRKMIRDR